MRKEKVIGKNQHGFAKYKLCMTNLIAFYSTMTGFVDEWRTVDCICLQFGKPLVSSSIFIATLQQYGLAE